MSRRLDGKVAIVTGAGRGIGQAIALRFAREGAAVIAAQRTVAEGDALVAQVESEGGRAAAIETDVRDVSSVENLIVGAVERYGRLDVLCNNAGVGQVDTVVGVTMKDYDDVMNANVRGTLLCMKFAVPVMLEQGDGSVINIASVLSFVGRPKAAAYCASKGAILALTRQVALDYAATGVRINAIAPGFVETEQFRTYCEAQPDPDAIVQEALALTPMGRFGTPDDVAGAAVYFACDDSTWVTGTALAVDGGMLCQ